MKNKLLQRLGKEFKKKKINILNPSLCSSEHSVQFSHSVVSDSLRPHELQPARPPCPHQLPEFTQTHVHQVNDAI